jgi:hypothetical protein
LPTYDLCPFAAKMLPIQPIREGKGFHVLYPAKAVGGATPR